MSNLTGTANTAAASSAAGYGLYNQLSRALGGDANKVVLLVNNVATVQFDCCLTEAHQYQAAPTMFPLEDGTAISDHLQVAPVGLQLTAVIADHPPETPQGLFDVGVSAVVSGGLQQLGAASVLAGTVGYTSLASAATKADSGNAVSRSAAIYSTLRQLQGSGHIDSDADSAAIQPTLVDVVTAKLGKPFCRFGDMAITDLSMQRDNSIGARCLVFNIALTQMRFAYREQTLLSVAQPEKAAQKRTSKAKTETKDTDAYEARRLAEGRTGAQDFSDIINTKGSFEAYPK